MTLALKMADIEYDAYESGFERGHEAGLQVGIQQGIEQGIEQGLERGAHQKALETAKNLLSMGLSPEQVAQGTNLPLEILQQIQSSL